MAPAAQPEEDEIDESDWEFNISVDELYENVEKLNDPGFLTKGDRELLLGRKEFPNNHQERKARARLRERIRTGLKDFDLLARKIEPRDREQILADITDYSEYPDKAYRTDEVRGMASALAFFYSVAVQADYDFSRIIEDGIFTALQWSQQEHAPYPNVEVDISVEAVQEDEELYEKLRSNEDLRPTEYHVLLRQAINDRGKFLLETEDVELPVVEKREQDETLSVGHSLIAYARSLADPSWLGPEIEMDIIHPRVLADFGVGGQSWPGEDPNLVRQGDEGYSKDQPSPNEVAEDL